MLEHIGDEDIIVRNYTDNFNVKEYIQEELIPKAFPNIPMNKLNLGFTGVISEYISQGIEDSVGTASLLHNESFITKAVLPSSIYAEASAYDLGYIFAEPSTCSFALQISLSDILKFAEDVQNTSIKRYILDKDTRIELGDYIYKLDYDIYIDYQYIDDRRVFNVYYNMDGSNSLSGLKNKYVKYSVSSIDWLILFLDLKEFDRDTDVVSITDNLITTNSDIEITWVGQIAGIDLTYISPSGQRIPMKIKPQYSKAETEPFAWYRFEDDDLMKLSFSSNDGYWSPEFNSSIEYTVYTTNGADAKFTSYDRRSGIPVGSEGENYPYNEDTKMVALCYSGSSGGYNKGNIEDLRNEVITAKNTVDVLTTDTDLDLWFEKYGKRNNNRSKFFKRRDDPTGRLFSQFIALKDDTYIYPTNTLNIKVAYDQFDYINDGSNGNKEYIIKPGHIWEYDDNDSDISRDTLRMVPGTDGYAMISDDVIPTITESRPFMFVNPFLIKINKIPTASANYNYLINHTSWPETIEVKTDCVYQFQMAQFSIDRTISNTNNNMYHIEAVVVPVINDSSITYIEGIGDDFPKENNNLRLVLITRTKQDGETGYIEMNPIEIRNSGAVLYEVNIAVEDNIRSDNKIEIDLDRTDGIRSLMDDGKVFIDSSETNFHFAVMMKDLNNTNSGLYNNPTYDDYVMANRFQNDYRDLVLYQPLSMMRSTITFDNDYLTAKLLPFLRYDIPLDDERMSYFIQAFDEQYNAMKPVLSKLNGNDFIDFKLYNTYGRSLNYYIGPQPGVPVLKDSTILLDNVYVNMRLVISVYDRSMFTQTSEDVVNQIIKTFESLDSNNNTDLYVSDIINDIITNTPNVRYLRFLGFNTYNADQQAIFVKYNDISELQEDELKIRVPEMIRADSNSIEIKEET